MSHKKNNDCLAYNLVELDGFDWPETRGYKPNIKSGKNKRERERQKKKRNSKKTEEGEGGGRGGNERKEISTKATGTET